MLAAQPLLEFLNALNDLIAVIVAGPWVLPTVFLLAMIDGFFPAVPSESVVISVAAVSVAGAGPALWMLILVAAAGAFMGDQIAFSIGRAIPVERIPFLNRGQGLELVEKANAVILQRPAPLLVGGRFIPGGRVAVNLSAGAMDFPRKRFMQIDAVAALLWASYSALLGMTAGAYLHDHPILAATVGVVLGVGMGYLLDRGMTLWEKLRARQG